MDMSETTLHVYEALTEAGASPATARNAERAIEGAIVRGQNQAEKNMLDKVMTKEDGLRLEQRIDQKFAAMDQKFAAIDQKIESLHLDVDRKIAQVQVAISNQIIGLQRWMIGSVFGAVGLAITISKLL